MKTIVKYAILIITAVIMLSCKTDFNFSGVKGNGNVTTTKRFSGKEFNSIKVSQGLNVIITQSKKTSVKVQADENLQDLIKTDIENGVLHIYAEEQIGSSSTKKILVHITNIDSIKSSSGADVNNTNTLNAKHLKLSTSSGSDINLNINTTVLTCTSSSGSAIDLKGNTTSLIANASSGSNIDADKLIAKQCTAEASSGASIDVNCTNSITANASSGGNIGYIGNPTEVVKTKSSGGSVSRNN